MSPAPDPFHHDGLTGLYAMLVTLQADVKTQAISTVRLENSLGHLQRIVEDNVTVVNTLSRIIRDGNGKQSLMTRVELIEDALKRSTAGFEELRRLLETTRTEDSKGKWSLANTVVAGILGFLALIATQLLTQLIGKVKVP